MKNKEKIIIIIVAIIVILLALICIKVYKTKNEEKNEIANTQLKDVQIEDVTNIKSTENKSNNSSVNNVIEKNTTTSQNISKSENNTTVKENEEKTTNSEEKEETNNTNSDDDIVGKWNTIRVAEIKTDKVHDNLVEVFGTSYIKFGSSLILNKDNTFIDVIQPITDGSQSTTGKYEILRSYNKLGDCYVQLMYDDGRTLMLQKVYYDESNVPYLTFNLDDMSFDLKK